MTPDQTNRNDDRRMTRGERLLLGGAVVPVVAVVLTVGWGVSEVLHSVTHLPMWLTVPCGVAAGVLLISVIASTPGYRMLQELAGTCLLLIILASMLAPMFLQAKRKAVEVRRKAHLVSARQHQNSGR
jgi:hypothetical protein